MSRTYRALQKVVEPTAFCPDLSTSGMLETAWGLPEIPASPRGDTTQAVADLIQNQLLTHSFGVQGEWEVRTTLVANRQAWRYRCCVFVHGKEARKDFPPRDSDRTRQIRHVKAVTEEMLAAFAREAVEVHFTRCASVVEHILTASTSSQPSPRHQLMKTVALVLIGVATLVTAYWLWKGSESVTPEQPSSNQLERITPTPQLPAHWTW